MNAPVNAPTLQDAIDQAGSPIELLWKPGAPAWTVPVVEPEFAGWGAEQAAWRQNVALFDLSFHMFDTFLEGPDAVRLLREVSANNYDSFAIGQAKQFVPVSYDGNIIVDGILLRTGEEAFTLTGVPAAQNWVKYHAATGGYDVAYTTDPDSSVRKHGDPKLFRFQVQGPLAAYAVERAFGGPLPEVKFFHSVQVELNGIPVRALRHGMAGQAGYEFIGDFVHYNAVKEALLTAGESFGIHPVGGKAYFTNGVESGWIPTPTPAIYTDPRLEDYRRWLPKFSYEGMKPLGGSFYSDDIADYYVSPWELGYGRSISFTHDFIGRDALEAARDEARRTKVTLEFDRDDVARVLGTGAADYLNTYSRFRIERDGRLQGMTFWTSNIAPVGTVLSLALVDHSVAAAGTRVEVVWGEHPGHGTAPEADLGFPRIRATVQNSPYDEFARTAYRANATV
ncbi:aminomethyltransferase family protein [Microbacterium invictum]|uniref:Glycine cleavage system aminomethyltransferase T n=1 Tax=Microbacterium invictum TaxID=515415 RepID=A0AA40SQP2_9MICO|nr:aminomethyltransferase family protein [Microbacterium invictum]MBB4140487.1 glycine cleavage system aminomethyltransferase T [Microbacterium invictum]